MALRPRHAVPDITRQLRVEQHDFAGGHDTKRAHAQHDQAKVAHPGFMVSRVVQHIQTPARSVGHHDVPGFRARLQQMQPRRQTVQLRGHVAASRAVLQPGPHRHAEFPRALRRQELRIGRHVLRHPARLDRQYLIDQPVFHLLEGQIGQQGQRGHENSHRARQRSDDALGQRAPFIGRLRTARGASLIRSEA
ncbi:hypothetical protein CAL18_17115 [Bordetella genomosp. 7]|nr:hypothetical protein CAL18_17115 [Bordetella genomosp. 7]